MKRFLSWIANKSLGSFAQGIVKTYHIICKSIESNICHRCVATIPYTAIAPDDINFAPRKGDFGVRRLRIKDGVLLPYEVFADVKEGKKHATLFSVTLLVKFPAQLQLQNATIAHLHSILSFLLQPLLMM